MYWHGEAKELGVILAVLVVLGGALFGMAYLSRETPEQTQAIYEAWCRMNNRKDVSLEDWRTMRKNYMLPGMEAKKAAEAESAAAFAIGISAGAAAAR